MPVDIHPEEGVSGVELILTRYHAGNKLPVEAWDRGDVKQQAIGVLQSLDNQIDVTTGTLKFKGRFDNKDQALFPNQFVNVHLLADTLHNVVLAPSAAIQFGNNGTFVYKLDGDKKVKIQPLVIGDSDGDNTVIKQGLVAGDRVVLEGTDRLKDGSEIEVVNDSAEVLTTPTEHLQGKPAAKGETESFSHQPSNAGRLLPHSDKPAWRKARSVLTGSKST